MNWISVKDKLPEVAEQVLVFKNVLMGGYDKGIYIAVLARPSPYKDELFFLIKDSETNHNNYRFIDEFSYWMPLPERPK